MDKATTLLLLESYRPEDADDPAFAEALRQVTTDPELAARFGEMQDFDAAMRAKLRAVPVPADVKGHILLGRHAASDVVAFPRRAMAWIGAVAAAVVLGLGGWWLAAPKHQPGRALALQAIACTERMPALQFVCFDAAVVASWVNEQPDTRRMGLALPDPGKSLSMEMIGSSIVHWEGRPVVMICLQNGRRMAMLYVLGANDVPELKDGATETMQQADWIVRTSKSGGRVRVLATKGGPEDLNFSMPF